MVLWLNGAFGVGKTTVARSLLPLLPGARIADPERIGYVLQRTFWRGVDYRDVELWRRLTRLQTRRGARRSAVIVPMTVCRPEVLAQVADGARVLLLTAAHATLQRRIEGSGEAVEWRRRNVERCLAAFDRGGFGEPIDTDGRAPEAVAREIVRRV